MKKINFTKMVATGNDFIVMDFRPFRLRQGFGGQASIVHHPSWQKLVTSICQRRVGIGADGVLVLEKSKKADFKMRIFNIDGSEAQMCGNGLQCATLFVGGTKRLKVETKAGFYEAEITAKESVKVKMVEPKDLKINLPIIINDRAIKVNFINTGVPHVVIFVSGIDEIDVEGIGQNVRYHKEFSPKGANVDFVEVINNKNIKMRTYERGVEGETLACGTGAVASAIVTMGDGRRTKDEGSTALTTGGRGTKRKVSVHTKGGVLKVSFSVKGSEIEDVYLEGEAREVFVGSVTV